MKAKFFSLAAILMALSMVSYSQTAWDTDGNAGSTPGKLGTTDTVSLKVISGNKVRIYVNSSNGNVGIGNQAPAAKLHVTGGVNVDGDLKMSNSTKTLQFADPVVGHVPMMTMFKTGTSNLTRMVIAHSPAFPDWGLRYDDVNDRWAFVAAGTPTFAIDQTGNVTAGNNVTASNNVLGVNMIASGNMNATGNILADGFMSANGNISAGGNIQSAMHVIATGTVSGHDIVADSSIQFGTVESFIDGGANTIATNNNLRPDADNAWDLGNSSNRWNDIYSGGTINGLDGNLSGQLRIGTTTGGAPLSVRSVGTSLTANGSIQVGEVNTTNLSIDNNEIQARSDSAGGTLYLQFWGGNLDALAGGGNAYLRGNVAVGGTQLASGYKLSVNGKAIAEEVKVDLRANWPDYVFDKNYKLLPLDELERKLNFDKHLPGVPSATEVKANGIMLGEMQTKTMEKVEENTLYIIQLNNKIKELEKMNAKILELERKIEELTKQK